MPGSEKDSADQPNLEELITLTKAAEISGLSHSHLRHLARTGEIWAIRIGYPWFTTEQAVREYLARDRRPGPKPEKGSGSDS